MALRIFRSLRVACFLLSAAACATNAIAAPTQSGSLQTLKENKKSDSAEAKDDSYVYVIDQDLTQILKEFGRRKGLKIQVESEIQKRVRNQRIPLEQTAFVKFIKDRYDLTVIQDGKTLTFSPPSQIVSRMFTLNDIEVSDLVETAKEAGIDLRQYSMRTMPGTNSIILEAPAPILGQVSAIIETLSRARPAITVVKSGHITMGPRESTQKPQ